MTATEIIDRVEQALGESGTDPRTRRVLGAARRLLDGDGDDLVGLGRDDRHRVELIVLATSGDEMRAVVLSREYLAEFPDDVLVEMLLHVIQSD